MPTRKSRGRRRHGREGEGGASSPPPPTEPVFARPTPRSALHPLAQWRAAVEALSFRTLRRNLRLFDGVMASMLHGQGLLAWRELQCLAPPSIREKRKAYAYAAMSQEYVRRRYRIADLMRAGEPALVVDSRTAWNLAAAHKPERFEGTLDGQAVEVDDLLPRLVSTGEWIVTPSEACIDHRAPLQALRVRCSGCGAYVGTTDAARHRCPRCFAHAFCSRDCSRKHKQAHKAACDLEVAAALEAVDDLEALPGFPFTRLLVDAEVLGIPVELAIEMPEAPSTLWTGVLDDPHPVVLENPTLASAALRDRIAYGRREV